MSKHKQSAASSSSSFSAKDADWSDVDEMKTNLINKTNLNLILNLAAGCWANLK